MRQVAIVVAVLISFSLACAGQATGQPAAALPEAQQEAVAAEPVIAGGDLLDISIFGTDFNCGGTSENSGNGSCQIRVSNAGYIMLPPIGQLKVSGLTISQAEKMIGARLAQGYFVDPQVKIVQKEMTQGISVLGEVQKPGTYPLRGSPTLLQAISAAGGTTVKAGDNVSIIHRGQANQPQGGHLKADGNKITLLPGDTVMVAKAGIVYVIGDVHQPSGIVMEDSGLTVLQAIAMAQGMNSTASLDKAKLIRKSVGGKQEIPLPLRKILANKAPDPELQPEDIIYVPNSSTKSAARRGLEAVLQTATGVAIYRR